MKHFPGQLCLHCYGQLILNTLSDPLMLRVSCLFCFFYLTLTSLSDDGTLKDRLTVFCFHEKVFLCRGLKVSVKSSEVFFVTVGLGVYPSPLSVAKLRPRMSYHRHICRKYAMKLCGSCTIRAICPPTTHTHLRSLPSCTPLGLRVSETALPSRLPLASMSYLCQLVKTTTWAQQSMRRHTKFPLWSFV